MELLKDHNPANVPLEKVGFSDGWRLLMEKEVSVFPLPDGEIDIWWDGDHWKPLTEPVANLSNYTYRTKIPPDQYKTPERWMEPELWVALDETDASDTIPKVNANPHYNRALKFRLFDKADRKFWQNGQGWDIYSLCCAYREVLHSTIDPNGRFQLIQFTGLFDKNGKEIYEGDILNRGGSIGQVIYVNGMLFFWDRGHKTYEEFVRCDVATYEECQTSIGGYFDDATMSDTEVIGNVFENPELLITNEQTN